MRRPAEIGRRGDRVSTAGAIAVAASSAALATLTGGVTVLWRSLVRGRAKIDALERQVAQSSVTHALSRLEDVAARLERLAREHEHRIRELEAAIALAEAREHVGRPRVRKRPTAGDPPG